MTLLQAAGHSQNGGGTAGHPQRFKADPRPRKLRGTLTQRTLLAFVSKIVSVTWNIVTVPEWQHPFRLRAGRIPVWNHDVQQGPPRQVIAEAKA